jgi:hypothetical protein
MRCVTAKGAQDERQPFSAGLWSVELSECTYGSGESKHVTGAITPRCGTDVVRRAKAYDVRNYVNQ